MNDRLLKIINDVFNTEFGLENRSEINPDAVNKWDSLAHLNLVICLEDEFGLMFEPSEIAEMLGGFDSITEVLAKKGVK